MPRVEIGRDGTARCAASLDATLGMCAQGLSLLGRLGPIDLGLLRIAKPDAARLGRSEGMARALAYSCAARDSAAGGEHVEQGFDRIRGRQPRH